MTKATTATKAPPRTSGLIALLAGAHFSHHVLTALLAPLLPFIRDEFSLSYAQSGVVTSAFTLAYGLAQLPAGWLSDRIGPRYLLLVGITGVAAAGAFIGLSPSFGLLLVGLVLMGIAGGGYHPASSAVISRIVRPERRGRALGVHIVGGSSSHFLAPLIAAGLVTLAGWRGSFLSLAIPVAIIGVVLFGLIQRRIHNAPGRVDAGAETAGDRDAKNAEPADRRPGHAEGTLTRDRPDARAGAPAGQSAEATTDRIASAGHDASETTVRTQAEPHRLAVPRMVFFLILTGFIGAGIGTVIPFIPLYLTDVRGIDDRLAAGFISIIFGAGFFAAPLGGWLSDVFGRTRVMVVTGLLTAPALALIVVTPFPLGMGVLLLAIGMLMFTKMPTAEAHIASEVSEKHRTTVLGIYFFSGMEGSAILTPLLGAAIDRWGFDAGLLGLAGGLLAIALLCSAMLAVLHRGWRPHRR